MKNYTILKPKNTIFSKVEKRLRGRTYNCGICETKSLIFTDKSIITKENDSQIIHALNYCPKCDQRFPIRVDLDDSSVFLIKFPDWEDDDNIYPNRRVD